MAATSHMAIYGIKRFNFRVACPCAPSCLKIYLCYRFFPLLNSSFTILFSYFCSSLCFLSVPNQQRSHFSLHDFTIKSLYLERKNQTIITPQNSSQKFVSTSYFAHMTSKYCRSSPLFAHSRLACIFAACLAAHFAACVASRHTARSLSPYHIEFFIEFFLYFILLIHISSYRLLKKGSTSPCSIILIAGSSHCKCINMVPRSRPEPTPTSPHHMVTTNTVIRLQWDEPAIRMIERGLVDPFFNNL